MSDQSQGPAWWMASDGKWYAPEQHPNFVPPVPAEGPPGISPPLPPYAQVAPAVTQVPRTPSATAPDEMVIGPTRPSSPNGSRRWRLWAIPVIAAGLALAIVLPLTMGGASRTTSTTTATSAGASSLTGSYFANAPGPQPLYLTLVQSHDSLTGAFIGVSPSTRPPLRLITSSIKVTGTVKGSRFNLQLRDAGQSDSVTGNVSGTSLTLDSGQGASVVFKRGTMVQFDALVARDRGSILKQATMVSSRAAESNLTNAITEAKAMFQVNQAYSSGDGQPYGSHDFTSQAPEFVWSNGSCNAAEANCISFQVIDVNGEHDAQGVVLAAFSPESSTCWYAIDLEAAPAVIPSDASAFQSTVHSANRSLSTAGVFYARSPVGSSPTSCTASLALHAHHAAWADDYPGAGGLS